MNRLNQVLCGLAACVVCQEAGMSMNQQRQDHPASMSIQDLRRQNTQKLIEVFSEAEIEQMRNMPKAEADDQVGNGVTLSLLDFGKITGIDRKVFYSLTNHIHSLNKATQYKYLKGIGIEGKGENLLNLQEGLGIVTNSFPEATLDQKCLLLAQMGEWLFWVDNIVEGLASLPTNNWFGTNNYEALSFQVDQQYACLFLRTLLLL